MTKTKKKWHAFLSIIGLILLVTGCALDAYRMHPEFDIRAGSIRESVLITPDVSMYELSSGGQAMLRDDWSGSVAKTCKMPFYRILRRKIAR